jgi:predicted amidohydrolase
MVHHTNSTLALAEVLGALRPGDIYTHCYSAYAGEGDSLVDRAAGQVREEALAARARGVLFDLGHGQGSLDWAVAELAMKQGFLPDTVRQLLTTRHWTLTGTAGQHGPALGERGRGRPEPALGPQQDAAPRSVYRAGARMTSALPGMPLEAALRAATEAPARALGRSGVLI